MVDVGDRVLVMPSFSENVAVPLGELSEGDQVLLYNLKDDTRIAVPTLSLNVGDRVFSSPSFDFAGFNWKVDFDFKLIPLSPLFFGYTDHDFKCVTGGATYYGDSGMSRSGGCVKMSPRYGDIEYAFTDATFEEYPKPDDGSLCIKFLSGGLLEIWVVSAPYYDYGSGDSVAFYILNKRVWSGTISPGYPGRVWYHISGWSPV